MKPTTSKSVLKICIVLGILLTTIQLARFEESSKHAYFVSPVPQVYAVNVEEPVKTKAVEMADLPEQEANIRIIKKVWGKAWKTGVAIAKCESGLRSQAVNEHNSDGSVDVGLFQINSIHGWSREELLNPIANAGIAYSKFVEQGTNPWYSSEKCWKEKI